MESDLRLVFSREEGSSASLIGVAIACAGNVLISLALTIQKLAHSRIDDSIQHSSQAMHTPKRNTPARVDEEGHIHLDSESEPTSSPTSQTSAMSTPSTPATQNSVSTNGAPYLRSRLWWLGLSMMAIGEAGNFLSYGFAPAAVVAPLGTVALVANCVFAPLILGESFTKRNVLGVALAIIGAVTVVYSTRDSNPRLSPGELVSAITAIPFIVYTSIVTAILIPLVYMSGREDIGGRYIVIDLATCALFGGYTVMSTKALSSLLSTRFLAAFRYPVAWGAIAVLVITSVLQIKFLNRALMRFESKEVIPTQFVFFSLSAIVGSAVLYGEFKDVRFSEIVNFIFGISTTFLGVYFLTTPPPSSSPRLLPLSTVDEDTPLLQPTPLPPRRASLASSLHGFPFTTTQANGHNHTLSGSSLNPTHAYTHTGGSSLGLTPAGNLAQPILNRLGKRPSTGNLGRGLQSQGGLLLLATTPPVPSPPLPVPAVGTGPFFASFGAPEGDEGTRRRRSSSSHSRRSNEVRRVGVSGQSPLSESAVPGGGRRVS